MNNTGRGKPFALLWKQLSAELARYRNHIIGDIRYQDVIGDLEQRTELSGSYISSIIFANLIALFGLLTNSVAVVIGAMLISPLMGPIFSLGLAFTMGDLVLSRRALRNIAFSILLTVSVAALFTLLSPLKGATHEILSRTRPNVYDLLIAVFAGTAGALALCTRKNYLFTTTGVAVATAVIPPLSVVGYGVGTWQLGIAAGGFLLFFTNLVAIVISSDIVFYLYGFKGSMAAETVYPARRRFQILGAVLAVISTPLIITLVTDIRKVNLTRRVESVLKAQLNVKQKSRLTTVSIDKDKEKGALMVAASINTVKYVDGDALKKVEKELSDRLDTPAKLDLEQVIVRSGAVNPVAPIRALAPVAAPPPPETLTTLREKAMLQLKASCREMESYITPYKITDCGLLFSDRGKPITVHLTIARDYPPDARELRWLGTALKKALNETIDVKVETIPLLPTIGFTDQDQVDEPSRKALESLRQILVQLPVSQLTIEAPRGTRRSAPITRRQVGRLKDYLIKELKVSGEHISVKTGNDNLTRVTIKN
jgi:uncharacterized hydrophobic protein (TIGR00271 family)